MVRWEWLLTLALALALVGGCDMDSGGLGGDDAPVGLVGDPAGGGGQNAAVNQLTRLTQAGEFAKAHALVAEQAAAARQGNDPVAALSWRCKDLAVYRREDKPGERADLAGQLADDPAARDGRFVAAEAWTELYSALLAGGRTAQAQRLLEARCQALLAMTARPRWWHHQMADVVLRARALGDGDLARRALAQVRLPADDPYRELLGMSAGPDRTIQPGKGPS